MATPTAAPGMLPAALLPPRRRGRWRAAMALVLLVLGWHVWLAGRLVPVAPAAGAPRPGLVQLRSLPAPAEDQAALAAAAALAVPPAAPMAAQPLRRPTPSPADPARSVAAPAAVADALPAAGPAEPLPADGATPTDTDIDTGPAGEPPPVYPTQLPPPAQLRYSLRLNGQAGEAVLAWQHDGRHYRLSLVGQAASGAPLLHQASDGQIDTHGLAPDRYVDSRRGGRLQAANFRRDIGRIGYSGPPQQHPAWPGAQDRLSWLVQLAAILAAAEPPLPDALRLFITDARGHAGLWQLQRQPDATGPTPWGDAPLQHWQREPPRPEGLRVDVWLAAEAGAPAANWPVRLRLQVPRSGDTVELQLLAAP